MTRFEQGMNKLRFLCPSVPPAPEKKKKMGVVMDEVEVRRRLGRQA